MPDVLIFGEYGSLNGGENSFLATVPFLREAGWNVSAAVPTETDFARALDQANVTVYPLWLTGLDGSRHSQEQIRSSMANIINETRPDVVHANSLSTSRLLGPVAHELNIPGSGHLRDIIKCSAKAISDINQLNRIIAVSKATANYHASFGMDEAKLRVIYNGVDTDRFAPPSVRHRNTEIPSAIRAELNLPASAFLVLYVGQIGMRKGIESALQAMQAPLQNHDDVHLLLVGERHSTKQEAVEYEKLCQDQSRQINEQQTHWLGRRTDVAELMSQCDLLIHMPRQEPLGRVLLEAAASGLPMITTDVGGTREILTGLEELIIPAQESYENCFDFEKFYRDVDYHVEISQRLRQRALDCFEDSRAGQILANHFSDLLNPNSSTD